MCPTPLPLTNCRLSIFDVKMTEKAFLYLMKDAWLGPPHKHRTADWCGTGGGKTVLS